MRFVMAFWQQSLLRHRHTPVTCRCVHASVTRTACGAMSNYLRAIRVSCEWNEDSHKRDQDGSRSGASTLAPAECNWHASTIKLYPSVAAIHLLLIRWAHFYSEWLKLHFSLMRKYYKIRNYVMFVRELCRRRINISYRKFFVYSII